MPESSPVPKRPEGPSRGLCRVLSYRLYRRYGSAGSPGRREIFPGFGGVHARKGDDDNTAGVPIAVHGLDLGAGDNLLAAMRLQSRTHLVDLLLHTFEVLDV